MVTATRTEQPTNTTRNRALAVLAAVLATIAVWVVSDPILGTDLTVAQPDREPMEVGFGPLAFVSLAAALLGWGTVTLLERLTARGTLIWTVLAVLVLALSFLPLTGVTATGGAKVTLALTHFTVALPLIAVFWNTRRR